MAGMPSAPAPAPVVVSAAFSLRVHTTLSGSLVQQAVPVVALALPPAAPLVVLSLGTTAGGMAETDATYAAGTGDDDDDAPPGTDNTPPGWGRCEKGGYVRLGLRGAADLEWL